jgi:hypothetical protein
MEDARLRKGVPRTLVLSVALLLAAPALALLHHVVKRGRHVHKPRPVAGTPLSNRNLTPFPRSKAIVSVTWTSPRYDPPKNQQGDILPTIWADDGDQYTIMDDGGMNVPAKAGRWRQSLARITGTPPNIGFTYVGAATDPPPSASPADDANDPQAHDGPLGPFYSSGLVEADHVFYATQENDWDWNHNGTFTGLMGIAYSRDRGLHWQFPYKPFPAPLGNLNWVIRGRGGVYPDGYVYAIASEREFNASSLILGRSRPTVRDMTNPAHWQWLTAWTGQGAARRPMFTSSFAEAQPIASWGSHITYPQMAYDAGLHRYLLSFTYSYVSTPPGLWQAGAELVIAESKNPWGPFSHVAHEADFGPSNGYGASFPVKWISPDGRDLWLKWAANFDGCAQVLDCSGGYGFNYRRIHLTLATDP